MNTANFENKASCIMYIFSLLNRLSTNHIKIDKYSFLSRYIQDFDFLGQKKSLRRLDGRGHFWTSIWFPLRLRALYREKRKYSNFITKIYWFFFLLFTSLCPEISFWKVQFDLMSILLTIQPRYGGCVVNKLPIGYALKFQVWNFWL